MVPHGKFSQFLLADSRMADAGGGLRGMLTVLGTAVCLR